MFFFGKGKKKENASATRQEPLHWTKYGNNQMYKNGTPTPGMSEADIKFELTENADYWNKVTVKPKEKVKYNFTDKEQIDYIREATSKNVWYYKDRMMIARGPCNLHVLRSCWTHGVIDENTLVWGQGLIDWLPARNVRTLVAQIRTVDVQIATWLKRQFGLKPALKRIRKHRAAARKHQTDQVDNMF